MAQDDFLYVEVIGERNLLRNIDRMPDTVRAILLEKAKIWTNKLMERVIENITARLKSKSGRLLEGVKMEIVENGVRIDGRVYIEGVPYARAQEEGASTPPHMIYPKNGKILAFMAASGHKVFASRVFHPGGQVLGQHFMKDALRSMGPEISRGVKTSVVEGIRRNMRESQ
jgi:hypothetical protein